jgi:hypothetical protein
MSKPTKNYKDMTEEEQKEYCKYHLSAKVYPDGKAFAFCEVDLAEEGKVVSEALLNSLWVTATFNYPRFAQILRKAGFSEEKIKEYSKRVSILDELYQRSEWRE